MLVAGIASFAGNAAIAGICGIASNWEGTGLLGGGGCASLRGSRWVGAPASSERPLAAIAGNSAIAGNDGAVSEPVLASTTPCSHQAAAYLRTFNPKVVGSSPTGGTAAFTLAPAFRRLRVTSPSHAPPCSATLKGAARQGRNRTEGLHTGSATAPESTRALHKTR